MVKIKNLEMRDALEIIKSRVNRLAMCKRGHIETEINQRLQALGPLPTFTSEEKLEIEKKLQKKLQKQLTPSLALIKRCDYNIRKIVNQLHDRALKTRENAFKHPDTDKWYEDRQRLIDEKETRIALLDVDFQDVIDEFTLSERSLKDLPAVLLGLEAMTY